MTLPSEDRDILHRCHRCNTQIKDHDEKGCSEELVSIVTTYEAVAHLIDLRVEEAFYKEAYHAWQRWGQRPETPLSELGLDTRLSNAIMRSGHQTAESVDQALSDCNSAGTPALRRIPGVGPLSIKLIEDKLEQWKRKNVDT